MAATPGRTGSAQAVAATTSGTAEEVFNSLDHGGPVRGMVITAGVETIYVNIPLLHKTSWVTMASGDTIEFYAPFRGMDAINIYSTTGAGTATWYPNLA